MSAPGDLVELNIAGICAPCYGLRSARGDIARDTISPSLPDRCLDPDACREQLAALVRAAAALAKPAA